MAERYELVVFEKFRVLNATKYKPHRIGSALKGKDGSFSIFIPPGISVSGRVVLLPPDMAKMSEGELMAAYQAAADDYGV